MRFLLPYSVSILLAGCASSLSIRADVNGSSPSSGDTGNSTSSNPPTNLPPPDYEGPFTVQTAVQIDAPLDKVWDAFTDFAKYPEWNPFVRSQVVVDENKKPLEDQTPAVDKYLDMQVHIPPTLDDLLSTTDAFERIIYFDATIHRAAWKALFPEWFLRAERWQAVSAIEGGNRSLYESREVFAGSGAYLLKWFIGEALQKSFDSMGEALKARVEQ